MGNPRAYFWKVDVDDFVQRVLSIVRYSDSAFVTFKPDPFMLFRVIDIFRNLILAFHRKTFPGIYWTIRFDIKIPRKDYLVARKPLLRLIAACSQGLALYLPEEFWDFCPAFDSEHLA